MKFNQQFTVHADTEHLSPGITIEADSMHKGHCRIHIEGGGLDGYAIDEAEQIAGAILRTVAKAKAMHRKIHGERLP